MVRERITITIKEDLLNQVDRLVDGLTIRSRSQAVEYLLTKFLSDFRLNKALVLAGGPTKSIMFDKQIKFLAEIGEKSLIERVLENLNSFNINNFLIYLDNHKSKIIESISEKRFPFNVSFLEGERPAGTIEALLRAKNELKDTFLVAYGDTICNINLNDMLNFHRNNNNLATVALTTVSNPRNYGCVALEGNKIKEFVEKPKTEFKSYLVSAGYFIFEPEIFRHISRNMRSIERDLFPKLADRGMLSGYAFQGLYLNVNSRADLQRAKALL